MPSVSPTTTGLALRLVNLSLRVVSDQQQGSGRATPPISLSFLGSYLMDGPPRAKFATPEEESCMIVRAVGFHLVGKVVVGDGAAATGHVLDDDLWIARQVFRQIARHQPARGVGTAALDRRQ